MPDTKIEEPNTTTKTVSPPAQENGTGTTSSPVQNPLSEKKISTPIAPILNQKKHQDKNELEKQKTAQQNYVADLTSSLNKSEASIKKTASYLANLQKAYDQAKTTNKDVAYKLANSIAQVKAGLTTQNKQKSLLKHHAQEANKTLQELHEHLAKAESGSKPKGATSVSGVGVAGGFLLGNAIVNKLFRRKKKGSVQVSAPEGSNVQITSNVEGVEYGQTETSADPSNVTITSSSNKSLTTTGAAAAPVQALGMAKKIAQTVKNIVKTVKNIAKVIRIATTSATVIGAVANVALLLKDKLKKVLKVIAKIIAGVQALLLLMWLWLLAKIAGILAGIAFGAISGLPLLLIPGAGPFLYAGWVGYWAYKGWTDPLGTIQIATHPWQLITRPVQWIGDQLSGWGGTAKGGVDAVAGGVGNITGGFFSGVGNFVTGLASAGWGAATSIAGGVASTAGSIASSIWGGISGASSAAAGNIAAVAVGGGIGTTMTLSLIGTITTNSALYSPALDPTEQFNVPGVNELFTIAKTVDDSRIETPLESRPVTFTVTVTADDTPLTNLLFSDSTTTNNGTDFTTGTDTCTSSPPPPTLAPGATWTCTLVVNANATQDGATITNIATFTATTEDGSSTKTDTSTAYVHVGDIPTGGCPKGWPATGLITQGPEGGTSHGVGAFSPTDPGYEALDIGKPIGENIYSTIDGTVVNIWQRDSLDQRVEIAPFSCPLLSVVAFWHNSQILVSEGDTVTFGQIIAKSGAYTGSGGPAPHLHYQFNLGGSRAFLLVEPYIPYSGFARTCNGDCGYTITSAP